MELTRESERLLSPIPKGNDDWLLLRLNEDGDAFLASIVRLEHRVEPPPPRTLFEWAEQQNSLGDERPELVRDNLGIPLVLAARGPSWRLRNAMGRVPESKIERRRSVDDREEWSLAATDTTVLVLDRAWGRDRIIFRDEDAETVYDFLLLRFTAQEARAQMQARFKLDGIVPPEFKGYQKHPERPLADYQRVALQLCKDSDGFALFMDPGTGKTAVGISRVMHEATEMEEERLYRVLVISPNQVRLNWQEEFDRFATIPGKVTVMRGGHLRRIKQLTACVRDEYPKRRWTALVCGYEAVTCEQELLRKVPWDLIILDESHYIRNTRTKRFKAINSLREISGSRLILTGSPIANSPMDLWSQLEFMGEGLSGFMRFDEFCKFFGQWKRVNGAGGVRELTGLKNVPLLQERLARVAFQITKDEAGLNLPDKVYDTYEVEMTPEQRKVYASIATKLAVEAKSELADPSSDKRMTVNHILTRLLRLAQVTSGYCKWDAEIDLDTGETTGDSAIHSFDPNPKLDAMMELIESEGPECKVIVWANFRENFRVISERLTEAGIKHGCYHGATSMDRREEFKNAFNNDPEFRVLVAQPQTAAEGLNLLGYDKDDPDGVTKGCYCGQEIFFSSNWSAVQRAQAEDRAHRRGTRMPVRITDLIVPGSIDQEIRSRVLAKQQMADLVTDISSILENVLELTS